jgi:hypothetical protein
MALLMINVDPEVLARATELATAGSTTVEAMVERLLRIVAIAPIDRQQLPPVAQHAYGMLSKTTDDQDAEILEEHRQRKYGNP